MKTEAITINTAELNKGDAAKIEDLKTELALIAKKFIFESEENKTMYQRVGLALEVLRNSI